MSQPVTVRPVLDQATRTSALTVIDEVYAREKRWIDGAEAEIPIDPTAAAQISWLLAMVGDEPAGVIRLAYDPDLRLPAELDVQIEPGFDLDAYLPGKRFVEIGRFMIRPRYRHRMRVALELMRAATVEVVGRGYSHFVTDVFEGDPHSPLGFHSRVLGFERVGTHRFGELRCAHLRVILVLDIARGHARLRANGNRALRSLADGLDDLLATPRLARSA